MKKIFVLGVVGLMLAGAGCVPPQQPSDSETPATSTAPGGETAAAHRSPTSTQTPARTGQTPARTPNQNIDNDDVDADETVDEYIERGVSIDSDACRNFFANSVTDADLLVVCKQHSVYATRMAKDVIAASPQGTKVYDKQAWLPEDPEGAAMLKVGEDSGMAMLEAHKAFEENLPVSALVVKARKLTNDWLKSIEVFEAKWGVKN